MITNADQIAWWWEHSPAQVMGGKPITASLVDNVAFNLFHTPDLALGDFYAGNVVFSVQLVTAAPQEVQVKTGFAKWVAAKATTGGLSADIQPDAVVVGTLSVGSLALTLGTNVAGAGAIFQLTANTDQVPGATFTVTYAIGQLAGPAPVVLG